MHSRVQAERRRIFSLRALLPGAVLATAMLARATAPSTLVELQHAFETPPDDARILMRWWWFGPAVTPPELEREMRAMKDAGIGGFEVQPVYPLALDNPGRGLRNLPYLSPKFLDAIRFTGDKAHELGLRMDLTLGTGWPFGGPHIPLAEAAMRLRVVRTRAGANGSAPDPPLGKGEERIGRYPLQDGSVLLLIASHTRQQVKRPAVGAEGFVLDPYNLLATQTHLQSVGEPLLRVLAANPPHAVFSDSLEIYNADWTSDLLAEFQKRRGYDLKPHLPALVLDLGEESAAVRHDWGKTLTELANERYLAPIEDWARQHGTRFRSQSYGTPPVSLSSNALADLPEGEGWNWRQFTATRWASSASHLYGKPVTSSETWTWLDSPAFRATPLDLKAEADRHFLEGINQLVGHGWPYSPPSEGEPGWRFYAAAALNEHNPWWIVMPDVSRYLQRISFLLRQGEPVNDVALYLPTDDAWARFKPGRTSLSDALSGLIGSGLISRILDAGYDFDFIDDAAIAKTGIRYRALILPGVERIPMETYRTIAQYARDGGLVIALGHTPSLAPGLEEPRADGPGIQQLSHELFFTINAPGRLLADQAGLGNALHRAVPPDAGLPRDVGFVHRKLDFADVYFMANTSNHWVRGQGTFRISGRTAAWWDPFTGKTAPAGNNPIALNLAPYESRVLVFSDDRIEVSPLAEAVHPASMDLSTGWTVTFTGAPPIHIEHLRSWTNDANREYFSGLVTYEKTVHLNRSWTEGRVYLNFGEGTPVITSEPRSGNGMRAMLDSPVAEAALVSVNGKRAGSIWRPPYEVEVTGLLQEGSDTIRVVVANLAINRLAKGPLPAYGKLNARYGQRFQPQDMDGLKPIPSGLFGPIHLIARRAKDEPSGYTAAR